MQLELLIEGLNAPERDDRLAALTEIYEMSRRGEIPTPEKTDFVNNHIHTIYSFSPYSPTKAVYMAWQNGLATAGIMDHDSLSGAKEFLAAAEIVGLPVTVGMECRASMRHTRLDGLRINNPDQKSIAYVALHGVPHQNIDMINNIFSYYRFCRNKRNRKMCEAITELMRPFGISLDFDRDVYPISMAKEGGSITERHILFALTKKITQRYRTPEEVVSFLTEEMKIPVSDKVKRQILSGRDTPDFYEYDILGALKSNLVEKFYIPAEAECPDIYELEKICRECGVVLAYAYLGDVGVSITGDKKAQRFEDGYTDLLFAEIERIGFNAVTYMPSRNTEEQLREIMELCDTHRLFQISGEDINSPRQPFLCHAMKADMFSHLSDAAYALIGHEKEATKDLDRAMFSPAVCREMPNLGERCAYFKKKALESCS